MRQQVICADGQSNLNWLSDNMIVAKGTAANIKE